MNTADRSIRGIDTALRRRFDIFDCPPDRHILELHYDHDLRPNHNLIGDSLYDGFEKLNEFLSSELDKGYAIGHSFFMKKVMDPQVLQDVWELQVEPILREYFYDRPDMQDSVYELSEYFGSNY